MKKSMPESLECKKEMGRNELFSFIPFGICVALILIMVYILGLAPIKKYELADSDCYLRLLRVEDLHKGGQWFDPVISRINPPNGQTSHWTRPFDALLLIGASFFAFFTDFETALFWWGVIISPFLLITTLIVLQWSVNPVLSSSKDAPFLACFIFVFQIATLNCFQPGRPDHHSLLAFLFVLSVGLILRIILSPINIRLCYIAGAISGLAVWVSVESLLATSLIMGMLGLLWILEDGDFLDKNFHYIIALFISVGLALVLERACISLFAEEYDRLSFVHFSVFGFIAMLWTVFFVLRRYTQLFENRKKRFLSIPVFAALLVIATLVSFPKFFKGPLVDIDPRLISILFKKIGELQPLISGTGSLVMPIQLLGFAVICFPFLFYLLLRKRQNVEWRGWFFITLSSLVFILISLNQIRWSIYVQVLLVIPMAKILVFLRQRGPEVGFLKTLKNVLLVLSFSVGFLLIGLLADVIFMRGEKGKSHQEVSLIRICDYLVKADEWKDRSLLILTHADFGAEIIYRTRHQVLSTTNHRTGHGILDTYEIMTADTDEMALELIEKRGIDLILLCPKSSETVFYSEPVNTSTFYNRLYENHVPNWLREVELPPDLSSSFLLFETIE